MKNLRLLLSGIVLLLLVAGYAASQIAAMGGPGFNDPNAPVNYAKAVDTPAVKWTALFVLIICIVFAFIRNPEADEK